MLLINPRKSGYLLHRLKVHSESCQEDDCTECAKAITANEIIGDSTLELMWEEPDWAGLVALNRLLSDAYGEVPEKYLQEFEVPDLEDEAPSESGEKPAPKKRARRR